MKSTGFLVVLLLLLGAGAWADENGVLGQFARSSMKLIDVPERIDVDLLFGADNAADRKRQGLKIDFNGDKTDDYIILYDPSGCGTGGCEYKLVDGSNRAFLGEVGGAPIYISKRKINGQPIITAYAHDSAGSGTYNTFVFDGKRYVIASRAFLQGEEAIQNVFSQEPDFLNAPVLK